MRGHYPRTGVALAAAVAAVTAVACAAPVSQDGRTASTGVAVRAKTAADARSASARYRLDQVVFAAGTRGYGVFAAYPHGRCQVAVARAADGGSRFTTPVPVASWRCASGRQPAGSLAVDAAGDGFLYGPRLFITHDGGRTWAASPQPGQVLAVAADGRSVWMLQARCRHRAGPGRCALRLLISADGGRAWRPAPDQPNAFAPGYNGVVRAGASQGQSWLVRTGKASGYVASLLIQPPAKPNASLWFTGTAGRSWSRRAVPCTGAAAALSVAPDGTLYAVCGDEPGAGAQGKTVAGSADGGRRWTTVLSCGIGQCHGPIVDGYLGSIDAVTARTVYLVGSRSPLLVSEDGGRRWRVVRAVTAGSDAGTSQVLFTSRSDGLVVGTDDVRPYPEVPVIWRTTDGGRRWSLIKPVVL